MTLSILARTCKTTGRHENIYQGKDGQSYKYGPCGGTLRYHGRDGQSYKGSLTLAKNKSDEE